MIFAIGDRVTCINTSLKGTVVRLLDKKNLVLLEDETSMELDYPTKTLVKIEAGIEQLTTKVPSPKDQKHQKSLTPNAQSLIIDLHTEKLPRNYRTSPALQGQLDYFEYKMALAIQQGTKKITVIHGRGNGILKNEITRLLKKLPQVKTFYDPEKILALKDSKLTVELK